MACPYFLPRERCEADLWPQRKRLPLGDGWRGECAAGGAPSDVELRNCNLGYAATCPHLPADRVADAVRFGAGNEANGRITILYICERGYLPGERGELEFDAANGACVTPHANPCVQRLAECYLAAHLKRRRA